MSTPPLVRLAFFVKVNNLTDMLYAEHTNVFWLNMATQIGAACRIAMHWQASESTFSYPG